MAVRIYSGPSLLDLSTKIEVLITGFAGNRSGNRKTGEMIQAWILRADMSPIDAILCNADHCICGGCPHKGNGFKGRSCYVNIRAPQGVWRGQRIDMTPVEASYLVAKENIRLGAYGDPAAIPTEVWAALLRDANAWTGYTHQWQWCDVRLQKFCMASVESLAEAQLARAAGWRTFRVGTNAEVPNGAEALCPASARAGHKLTCSECLHCNGTNGARGNIFIPIHGTPHAIQTFTTRVAAPQPSGVVSQVP